MINVTRAFGLFEFPLRPSCADDGIDDWTCTLFNAAGWIPGLAILSGAIRVYSAWYMVFPASGEKPSRASVIYGVTNLIRGTFEVGCVGAIFAPVDIAFCLKRRVVRAFSL